MARLAPAAARGGRGGYAMRSPKPFAAASDVLGTAVQILIVGAYGWTRADTHLR